MKTIITIIGILLFVVAIIWISEYDGAGNPGPPTKAVSAEIINYNNGVYYFPQTEADFGYALSEFIKNHPELKLITMTGNGTGGYGYDKGYFTYFERR